MILWAILTAMTVAVAVAISIPLIRRYEIGRSDRDLLVAVARDQVAELGSEVDRGTLSPDEAAEGRAEIDRRVLAAVKSSEGPGQVAPERRRLMGVVAISGWVVAGAAGLYAVLGQPELPAVSRAPAEVAAVETDGGDAEVAAAPAPAGAGSVEEMINGLVARLAENPEDADGWRMLGWSYFQTERYAEAAKAYGEAVKRDDTRPEVWSAYGEVLVRTAKGMVSEEAIAAFDHALAIDPKDPRAHFFKGMALEQAGNVSAAVEAWIKLVEGAEKGADWLPGVIERIDELSTAQGIDIGNRIEAWRPLAALPSADAAAPSDSSPGPTAEDVAAAQEMAPADRSAMIEGMVAKLDARLTDNPDDPEGWVKLINSRMVLNQPEAAAEALTRARTALAASPDKLQIVEDGAAAAGLSGN